MEFRKQVYSGVCRCGHDTWQHHTNFVMHEEARAVLGAYSFGECEWPHKFDPECNCQRFVDKDDTVAVE